VDLLYIDDNQYNEVETWAKKTLSLYEISNYGNKEVCGLNLDGGKTNEAFPRY
jgi:hypothetical protein